MVKVKKEVTRSDLSEKAQPSKRKQKSEEYLKYQKHIRSKEFKKVREIVIERDKCCQFCGRTEDELTLSNGKKLSWNVHHLPEGYKHLFDKPEEEAKYCRLFCSACHAAGHRAQSNRTRFTVTFTNTNLS